ncbi:hypothetical protein ACWOC1_02160 [Enterococcus quebecensis]|uniref:hypothetical protein n=1 Tax=Enterococcus quebecensis TaxID=903983 RepID=UPI00114CEA93|nr:hypothetical protein [Enterococcus quebecensis]
MFKCLICGFNKLEMEPYGTEYPSGEVCSCCGFQFGEDDDKGISHDWWRESWIKKGCPFWYMPDLPEHWDLEEQLKEIGIILEERNEIKNICPVCEFDGLDEPAYNTLGYGSYDICSCCGFQFGLHDDPQKIKGIKKWRENWIMNGCEWHYKPNKPKNWLSNQQLTSLVNRQYDK